MDACIVRHCHDNDNIGNKMTRELCQVPQFFETTSLVFKFVRLNINYLLLVLQLEVFIG